MNSYCIFRTVFCIIQKNNHGTATGQNWINSTGDTIQSYSPVDGQLIGSVTSTDYNAYQSVIETAAKAFAAWRTWPAPKRGEIVRQVGEALRLNKEPLGKLVSYEMGKSQRCY